MSAAAAVHLLSRCSQLAALLVYCLALNACGGAQNAAELPRLGPLNWDGAEETSRCAYKGRGDRDVVEAMAPGAPRPNVLRVYGYVGAGEDRRRILLCREVDTNFDGRKDLIRTFGDEGEKLSEQADSDYDGKVDTWVSFGPSGPSRIEIDKDGDGKAEEARIYEGGELARVRRDSNGDGKADIFENYRSGHLIRMGLDTNFDGSVDVWRRDASYLEEGEQQDDKDAGKETESQTKSPDVSAQ